MDETKSFLLCQEAFFCRFLWIKKESYSILEEKEVIPWLTVN